MVVAGHLVPASSQFPADNGWYFNLREWLYEFHMPFFMFLSGYVTFLSGAAYTRAEDWFTLTRRRAGRLLVPFLIFGLGIVAGKWLASELFHVDNLPNSGSRALMGLVWNTDESPATSVWYVAVLFVYCVMTPVLLRLCRAQALPLSIAAVCLYFVPIPHVLYLDRVGTYYVFFVIGGVCVQCEGGWLAGIDRHVGWLCALFAGVTIFLMLPPADGINWHTKMLIAGMLSIPALHGLVRRPALINSRFLRWLGFYSFIIYLLNTPFIGLIKGMMFKLLSWDGANFLLYAVLLMAGGIMGPVLVKREIFRRIPAIDRMTD